MSEIWLIFAKFFSFLAKSAYRFQISGISERRGSENRWVRRVKNLYVLTPETHQKKEPL